MSAVLVAEFGSFAQAEEVRTRLVADGFPTDRVELTARGEPGRAGSQPGQGDEQKFLQYYTTLLDDDPQRVIAQALAARVAAGHVVTIAVHPRGQIETARATQILKGAGAQQLLAHDLQHQRFEQAASPAQSPVVGHLLPQSPPRTD